MDRERIRRLRLTCTGWLSSEWGAALIWVTMFSLLSIFPSPPSREPEVGATSWAALLENRCHGTPLKLRPALWMCQCDMNVPPFCQAFIALWPTMKLITDLWLTDWQVLAPIMLELRWSSVKAVQLLVINAAYHFFCGEFFVMDYSILLRSLFLVKPLVTPNISNAVVCLWFSCIFSYNVLIPCGTASCLFSCLPAHTIKRLCQAVLDSKNCRISVTRCTFKCFKASTLCSSDTMDYNRSSYILTR